ncbi:MAG: signal peptidase II [Candidatus Aminicenantes bacterium]|nr:signal peptidase II [Candidatus Aminicenantes bacterium]
MTRKGGMLALAALLVVIDQLTKAAVAKGLALYETRRVIPGFLNLVHSRNDGAIFGFLSHGGNPALRWVLAAASVVALALVIYYFVKTPSRDGLMLTALSLILAGAVGNNLDRMARGSVVDFVDLYAGRFHWPVFNVADACITIGAGLLIFVVFRRKPA